jgi:hypothetical protein
MYCLIIESGFVSTSDSFNNRVAYKPGFIESSPGELTGSFVCLQPYLVGYEIEWVPLQIGLIWLSTGNGNGFIALLETPRPF